MKKLILSVLLVTSITAYAQPHGHWQHRGGYSPWVWVAPTVIGGVIGYEIARNQYPVVVQQQPIVVQQQPGQVYGYSPNCTPWTEVQNPNGTVTRTRTCAQ